MRRRMLHELKIPNPRSSLTVEVYDVLEETADDAIGVGFRIMQHKADDEWWVNVHPMDIDGLISTLKQARDLGLKRRYELQGS